MSTEASMTSLLSLLPTSTLTWDLAFLQGGSVSRDICSLKQKPLTYQKNQNSSIFCSSKLENERGFGFFYTLKVIYPGTVSFRNIFKSYKWSVGSVKLGILLPKRFRLGNFKLMGRTIVWMTLFSFHCKDCRSWFGMLPKKKQTKNSQITSQVNPNIDKIEDAFNQKFLPGYQIHFYLNTIISLI